MLNQKVKLIFAARARAKPRPIKGRWSMYLPKTYLEWCDNIRKQAIEQLRPQGWYLQESGAVLLLVKFYQKAWRGDADQLVGAMMDALQGAAYQDDCQVHLPMPYAEISDKDLIVVTLERPQRLSEGVMEWIRQGEVRQAGARKGRARQKAKGARRCTTSKRQSLYQRHTSLV